MTIDWDTAVSMLSQQECASRAGVDAVFVGRLVDLGLLRPADGVFTAGDVRRARLYEALERAGLPLDAMVEAIERGDLSFAFLDEPVYDRFANLTPSSFAQVSKEQGVPLELLMVIREAIGSGRPEADDLMRTDELQVVPVIALQISKGFDPAVIERTLRVYGDALRRIVETEADWWRTQVTTPSLESGLSDAEMLAATAEGADVMTALAEQALFAIYRANQDHIWNETLIDEVEDALDRAGLRDRLTTTPAICFLDITGYTRLTEERGDEAAAALALRLTPLVQRSAERHNGKVIKWLGDGVMFHFREPTSGVLAALEMLDAISAAGLPPAHIGLHAGPVVFQDGDYFGRTVNLAARIAGQAGPEQLLVSQEVVDAVAVDGVSFTPFGSVALKGVAEPVPLYSAQHTGPVPLRP